MKWKIGVTLLILISAAILAVESSRAADTPASQPAPLVTPATIPATLPGNGLAQHSFLYTGEWNYPSKVQTIFLIRDGKVAWTYDIPTYDANHVLQELGDATLLPNGNVVFCRKTGASEVSQDKKIVWNYDAPAGSEVHSIQAVGLDHVLMMQNGNPPLLSLINTVTGATEKTLTLPVGHLDKVHMQFRRVRLLPNGNFLATHSDMGKVVEYDPTGKEVWSVAAPQCWASERLDNGNTLIGCQSRGVIEVNVKGETVWSLTQKDVPEFKLFILQEAHRLADGNTVICNWCPNNIKDPKKWAGSVQVFEVTPDKKVVWALSSWTDPANLGPASSIQLLDEPLAEEPAVAK